MRYPGCQKAKAFKLFDQGKRPSEIYHLVKVKRHTLYCYYQLWKRERAEESERKRCSTACMPGVLQQNNSTVFRKKRDRGKVLH